MTRTTSFLDTLFALVLLAVTAAFLWDARVWELKAGLFPRVIGFPVLVLLIVYLVLKLSGVLKGGRASAESVFEYHLPREVVTRRALAFTAWILGFLAVIWTLNFLWGGTLVSLAYARFGAREKWLASLVLAASTFATVWLMQYQLNIPFPKGLVFELLEKLGGQP